MGFGERLKQARKAAGINGEELGRKLGASKSTISHWETELHQPDLDELNAICNELNVTADWLLGRESAQLTAEGMREARAYEQLSPEDRRKWRALRNTMFDTST